MFRTLTAAALAALASLTLSSAFAQGTAPAAHAKAKPAAKKPARTAAAPVAATNDNLNPGQLAVADRVMTGVADCEMKEKVDIEKIPGHNGNFKLVYARQAYVMVPEETTTGAVRLVDTKGAMVWIQIPAKSMLMNQKEHHRVVDGCVEDQQRAGTQSTAQADVNGVAPGSTVTTTTTTVTTAKVVPPAAVKTSSAAPAAAASGMWK